MAESPHVERLQEHQIDAAADLMNRVFTDQLRAISIEPTSEQKSAYLDGYQRIVRYFFAHCEPMVATIESKVVGLALWMPPRTLDPTKEERDEFGIDDLGRIFQETIGFTYPVNRKLVFFEYRSLKQPYWYLPPRLDVDPAYTNRGVASGLMKPILLRADECGLTCYVDTILPPMVPFFQKHGFEIMANGVDASSGVQYWTLRRYPQS